MKIKGIIIIILTLAILVTCFPFEVFAIKLDGALLENEWKKAKKFEIVSSSDTPNCGISNGILYIFRDESASSIYIGFKAETTDKIDENSVCGAAVSVDSGEFIYVTTEGISDYDAEKYSVEAEVCPYSGSVFSVEIALGIKYGVSTVNTLRVRLVDAKGSPSNIYTVDIPRSEASYSELVTQPTNNNQDIVDGGSERTTKPKITKAKTTKVKTTKAKTTKAKTTKVKTTKVKTTKVKTTKVKTTKVKTTKVKTTKVKTTKVKTTKVKTTKPNKTKLESTFYNYYVAQQQVSVQTTVDPYGEETTVITVREFKLQKGLAYTAICALILLALGICLAINYSRDKEKDKESKKKVKDKED